MPGPTTGGDIKVNERPDQLRRKVQLLKQEVRLLDAYVKGLPAYGGVWRDKEVTPAIVPITTAWTDLSGYNENRPDIPKKMNTDFTLGTVDVLETGVYGFQLAMSYGGTQGRWVDWGLSLNGADPELPATRQEIGTPPGDMNLTFTTLFSLIEAPIVYRVMAKGEIAMDIEFQIGGWSLHRIDYNNENMKHQKIM